MLYLNILYDFTTSTLLGITKKRQMRLTLFSEFFRSLIENPLHRRTY